MKNGKHDWKKQFLKEFNPYSTNEDIEKAIQKKNRRIPKRLYRFRSHPEYLESEMDGVLCFQPHSNLNDPFDGSIMQKHDDPIDYLREHQYLKSELLAKLFDGLYDQSVINQCIAHILSEENRISPKIKGISDAVYQKVITGIINRIELLIKNANERFQTQLDTYSQIVCFTEDLHNLPMWAHYANNHEGYCFEYNFTKLGHDNRFIKNLLLPVCYVDKLYDYPDVRFSLADKYNDLETTLLNRDYFFRTFIITKLMDWSYEREWRLIMGINELKNIGNIKKLPDSKQRRDCMKTPHAVNIIKPIALYFGAKMKIEQKAKEQIINKARENQIPVYQMETTIKGLHPIPVYEPTK